MEPSRPEQPWYATTSYDGKGNPVVTLTEPTPLHVEKRSWSWSVKPQPGSPTSKCHKMLPGTTTPCPAAYTNDGLLADHDRTIHEGMPWTCPHLGCKTVSGDKANAIRHCRQHQEGFRYQCPECGHKNKRRDLVKRHMKTIHKIENGKPTDLHSNPEAAIQPKAEQQQAQRRPRAATAAIRQRRHTHEPAPEANLAAQQPLPPLGPMYFGEQPTNQAFVVHGAVTPPTPPDMGRYQYHHGPYQPQAAMAASSQPGPPYFDVADLLAPARKPFGVEESEVWTFLPQYEQQEQEQLQPTQSRWQYDTPAYAPTIGEQFDMNSLHLPALEKSPFDVFDNTEVLEY